MKNLKKLMMFILIASLVATIQPEEKPALPVVTFVPNLPAKPGQVYTVDVWRYCKSDADESAVAECKKTTEEWVESFIHFEKVRNQGLLASVIDLGLMRKSAKFKDVGAALAGLKQDGCAYAEQLGFEIKDSNGDIVARRDLSSGLRGVHKPDTLEYVEGKDSAFIRLSGTLTPKTSSSLLTICDAYNYKKKYGKDNRLFAIKPTDNDVWDTCPCSDNDRQFDSTLASIAANHIVDLKLVKGGNMFGIASYPEIKEIRLKYYDERMWRPALLEKLAKIRNTAFIACDFAKAQEALAVQGERSLDHYNDAVANLGRKEEGARGLYSSDFSANDVIKRAKQGLPCLPSAHRRCVENALARAESSLKDADEDQDVKLKLLNAVWKECPEKTSL